MRLSYNQSKRNYNTYVTFLHNSSNEFASEFDRKRFKWVNSQPELNPCSGIKSLCTIYENNSVSHITFTLDT